MSEFANGIKNSGTGLLIRGLYYNFIEYWPVLCYTAFAYIAGRFSQDNVFGVGVVITGWTMISAWCRMKHQHRTEEVKVIQVPADDKPATKPKHCLACEAKNIAHGNEIFKLEREIFNLKMDKAFDKYQADYKASLAELKYDLAVELSKMSEEEAKAETK